MGGEAGECCDWLWPWLWFGLQSDPQQPPSPFPPPFSSTGSAPSFPLAVRHSLALLRPGSLPGMEHMKILFLACPVNSADSAALPAWQAVLWEVTEPEQRLSVRRGEGKQGKEQRLQAARGERGKDSGVPGVETAHRRGVGQESCRGKK